ncbi:hypothetical protein SO802_003419 [Lithocarpus litseifolius]|uniref:O-methyltransferase C-terminal domain-containing protein n=1 Tax=Lithocarpus litseifolius TaxID=425828 RepID=A0AAW2E021_9ROSI
MLVVPSFYQAGPVHKYSSQLIFYVGIEHVGGDMFHNLPKGDAIVMKNILHDWNDENCKKLLRTCYKALPDNGKGNIQSLTAADLDGYGAHARLLSPPCQPYTRQGLQKHSGDARAFSFLKILELIPHTSQPPSMLYVENVVGFETSDTHTKLIEILEKTNFVIQEFILSPLQFGVPYSRPRYFCLAKRKPSCFQNHFLGNKLLWSPIPLLEHDDTTVADEHDQSQENWDRLLQSCVPVQKFLEFEIVATNWITNLVVWTPPMFLLELLEILRDMIRGMSLLVAL